MVFYSVFEDTIQLFVLDFTLRKNNHFKGNRYLQE